MTKRPRARTSPIWTMPLDQLKQLVASCTSLSDILRGCGIRPVGHNNLTLKKRIKEDGIDISHIKLGRGAAFCKGGKGFKPQPKTLEQCMESIFIINHPDGKSSVRKYLKRYNLIEQRCRDCSLTDMWNGKPITLQLEHISGDSSDDRLENLCWLCPNCHSQTDTYTGKANRVKRTPKILAISKAPSLPSPSRHGQGQRKGPRPESHKVLHPSKDELQLMVWQKPMLQLASHYGVQSSNTVKEWALQMGVELPPQGYWQRRQKGYDHETALQPRPKRAKRTLKFTPYQIQQMRARIASGEKLTVIAHDFQCGHKTVRDIRDRIAYRWVD